MTKALLLVVAPAIAVVVASSTLAQIPMPRAENVEVGRYQLVHLSGDTVSVIDTATGQCWIRSGDTDGWLDWGNPTRAKPRKRQRPSEDSAVSLELPSKSLEMTVVQREERAIPGSDGSVRIRLGDITDGQVFLSVLTDDEEYLIERKSMSQGDSIDFSVGRKKYTVRVRDLRNVLIGDDFARIAVAEAGAKSASGKQPLSDDQSHDHSHEK